MPLLSLSLLPCVDGHEVLTTLRELFVCVDALINRGKLGFTLQSKMVCVIITCTVLKIIHLQNYVAFDICAVSELLQRKMVIVLTKVAI